MAKIDDQTFKPRSTPRGGSTSIVRDQKAETARQTELARQSAIRAAEELKASRAASQPPSQSTTTSQVTQATKAASSKLASKQPSKPQAESAVGTGEPISNTPEGGATGSGKRKIPCPNCTGKQVSDKNGRALQGITGLLSRTGAAILFPIILIWNYIRQFIPQQNSVILEDKCELCDGSQEIEDASDMSGEYEQVRANIEAMSAEIEENEANSVGIGGNDVEIIAGDKIVQVGLGTPSTIPSYTVMEDKGARVKDVVVKQKGCAQLGGKCNHVQGFPVASSPGGHLVISCDNSFKCITGPQGLEFVTKGPITLDGGITRITGPEVTVGAGQGRLLLEGDVISMGAKSVEVAPSDGAFVVKGKVGITGNMVVKGKVHAESLSFNSATCVGKNETSNISAATNRYGGPAFWGGLTTEGLIAALDELQSFAIKTAASPKMVEMIPTRRWIDDFNDNFLNLAYISKEIEPVITGICVTLAGPGLVFNFPHIHALPDGIHVHETRVPDIDIQDSAEAVRSLAASSGANSPAPVMTRRMGLLDTLQELIQSLLGLLGVVKKSPYVKL